MVSQQPSSSRPSITGAAPASRVPGYLRTGAGFGAVIGAASSARIWFTAETATKNAAMIRHQKQGTERG